MGFVHVVQQDRQVRLAALEDLAGPEVAMVGHGAAIIGPPGHGVIGARPARRRA
jgi:hypothetical protein